MALAAPAPAMADAEWQIRPFGAITFAGRTTLVDPDRAVGGAHFALGVSGGLMGEILGIEGDLAHAPGFFERGTQRLVSDSSVTTISGNVIVGLPRRATEYTLRPYFAGGFGVMLARSSDSLGSAPVSLTRPAINLGGGVFGPLSDRTGLSWELRHFRTVGEGIARGQTFVDREKLSFWRANMALVVRY